MWMGAGRAGCCVGVKEEAAVLFCEVFGGDDERVDVDILVLVILLPEVLGGKYWRCGIGGCILTPLGKCRQVWGVFKLELSFGDDNRDRW